VSESPAEAPTTDTNGTVDANDTAPAPERSESDQFSREYVEKIRRDAARYRTRVRELEPQAEKLAELEAATATETEKAVATARAEAEQATAEKYRGLLVRAEARSVAAELKFHDVDDAVRLVELGDVETAEDGGGEEALSGQGRVRADPA
jgi:ATPase subunit of ABC transporter with duplicated ATPase domains